MTIQQTLENYVKKMELYLGLGFDATFSYCANMFAKTINSNKLEPEYKSVIDKYNSIKARAKELGIIK